MRTDPDKPKHDGITVLVIDLHAPGVDVRPLREATGHALFNEVFFDDVFVSDEDVVGPVNGGWKVARSTLGNERVSIGGGGGGIGEPMFDLLDLAHRYADDDASALEPIGHLLSERASMRLLNLRTAERAVAGGEPGPEGNVAKLLSAEHSQRAAALRAAHHRPRRRAGRGPGRGRAADGGLRPLPHHRRRHVGDRPQPDRRTPPRPPPRPPPALTALRSRFGAVQRPLCRPGRRNRGQGRPRQVPWTGSTVLPSGIL